MPTLQTNKRRQELCFTVSGEVPTVPSPSSLVWGDAGFLSTDIMIGEIAVNIADNRIFTRTSDGIIELSSTQALSLAIAAIEASIPGNTDAIANTSSVSGASATDALNAILALIALRQSVANMQQSITPTSPYTYPSTTAVDDALSNISLEIVRAVNNTLSGNIDFHGFTGKNVAVAVDDGDIVPLNQVNNLIKNTFQFRGTWNASLGHYPSSDIKAYYAYIISDGGDLYGTQLLPGDIIYALIDDAIDHPSNWGTIIHGVRQATEATPGIAAIASAADAGNYLTNDDSTFITPYKLWSIFVPSLIYSQLTWYLKQAFLTAPRFSSAGASQYLKTDASNDLTSVSAIPAEDITQSSSRKFVPQASADNTFLVGQLSGNEWKEKSLADVKSILGSAFATVLTPSDQSGINNTANFVDINNLSFSAVANATYYINWMIFIETTASNGFRTSLKIPSGASMLITQTWYGTNFSQVLNTSDHYGVANFISIISPGWVRMEGYITIGATAGNVTGRIITSNVANVLKVFAGSGGIVAKK